MEDKNLAWLARPRELASLCTRSMHARTIRTHALTWAYFVHDDAKVVGQEIDDGHEVDERPIENVRFKFEAFLFRS